MRSRTIVIAALAAALAAIPVPAAQASPDDAVLDGSRHFDGRVTSVNQDRSRFAIRTEHGSRVGLKVTSRTRFARIAGFSELSRGLSVEVKAERGDNGWIARRVERRHGGRDSGHDSNDENDD